ncbi:MAG: hypothetical protein ACR2KX_06035 [Chitinophagaceae bacterium]
METKTSKAQLEVWEWKEKAYEEMKHLSTREQMNFIHEQTKEVVRKLKERKQLLKQHN